MRKDDVDGLGYLYSDCGEEITSRYADLLIDDVFKLAFGQESTKDVMIEFLNRVIPDRKIVEVDFMDKEMRSVNRREKNSVYDMNCETDDGTRIIVELQRRKQLDYAERAIYYSTFQIRNQVEAGTFGYNFCPVYVINILDFDLDVNEGNPNVLTTYRLCETTTHEQLTDKYTLIFIELRKFKKSEEELSTDILEGIYFCLKNMSVLNERPKQLEHEIFKKIFDVAELANMDEVKRSEILRKMTTERDLSNQMAYAIKVGREEGLEKGMAEGLEKGIKKGIEQGIEKGREKGMAEGIKEGSYAKSVEIAKRLKEMGMPVSDIVSATGLDSDKVSEL